LIRDINWKCMVIALLAMPLSHLFPHYTLEIGTLFGAIAGYQFRKDQEHQEHG